MNDTTLGIIIGGLIAGIPSIITTILNSQRSRRDTFDSAAITTALTGWENHRDTAKEYAARGYKARVAPPESYVIISLLFLDYARRGKFRGRNAAKNLAEIDETYRVIREWYERRSNRPEPKAQQAEAPNP